MIEARERDWTLVPVDRDVHRALKMSAVEQGISLKELVARIVNAYLSKKES